MRKCEDKERGTSAGEHDNENENERETVEQRPENHKQL